MKKSNNEGPIGHKGPMCWPAPWNIVNPGEEWKVDIVKFRNEQYSQDSKILQNLSPEKTLVEIDGLLKRKYEKLDAALSKMVR